MTNYANGDTGSDRAYEYEENARAERYESFVYWAEAHGFDLTDDAAHDDALDRYNNL